jgi:hypothetical protein
MGTKMAERSVVFPSIKKFFGKSVQPTSPARFDELRRASRRAERMFLLARENLYG